MEKQTWMGGMELLFLNQKLKNPPLFCYCRNEEERSINLAGFIIVHRVLQVTGTI